MKDQQIVEKTARYVKATFSEEATGHDWWHMYRVWQLSKKIATQEKQVNMLIVELGALLHDIADWKFHDGDFEAGPKAARGWLGNNGVAEPVIAAIEDIIRNVSFKGAGVASSMKTIEGKIIHDADKLDAMGAIGITRTFAYGGAHGRSQYDPDKSPEKHATFEAYKDSQGPTINHFYEKLLLLKDRMYTETARKIAEQRHQYMEKFLDEFYAEWEGKR